jgi:peptide deformylase
MAVRDVVLYPDAPLLDKATPLDEFGPELEKLARDMVETMDAYEGIGLAGPQVGVSRRVIVLREPESDQAFCLVNPEILAQDGEETAEEGCLSLPKLYAPVTRASRITVRAFDARGQECTFDAQGLHARIILHEVDHLDGILILDRLDLMTREAKLREWEEIRQQLGASASTR